MNGSPRRGKRFVVDIMLGKTAKWLRILGFETIYERLIDQDQVNAYRAHGYWILSRNRRWLDQPAVLTPTSNSPMEQLREVVLGAAITEDEVHLLSRCLRCNRLLKPIPRGDAGRHVPEYVFETSALFHQCSHCGKVYWHGSHSERMLSRLRHVLGWRI